MSVLITGSSGFIGREVIKSQNVKFKIVVRKNIKYVSNYEHNDTFSIDNIDRNTNWNGAFEGVTSVLHLAGIAHGKQSSSQDFDEVNYRGTIRLAEEAQRQGVKRFVFVSTIGVLGQNTSGMPFTENSEAAPYNEYSRSKLNAEIALREITNKGTMELVIVRPTLVYGAAAPGNFQRLTKLVKLLPILPFGAANNRRSFISVYNLADLLCCCLQREQAAGQTFNACEQEAISTKLFVNALAKGLDKSLIQLKLPPFLIKSLFICLGKKSMYDQLFGDLDVECSSLQEVLHWKPKYTLTESMQFLRNNND